MLLPLTAVTRRLLASVLLFVLAPTSVALADGSSRGPTLSTVAAASDRPAVCAVLYGKNGRKPSIWQITRRPLLGAYCDSIAKAQTLLESDPKAALEAAKKADEILPNQASSDAAIGRAKLALGEVGEAVSAFEAAKKIDERALDEPRAMNDFARSLVLAKRPLDSVLLYRALVPRADLLSGGARNLAYLRAAYVLMAHAATQTGDARSSDFLDAAAYLAEARGDETSRFNGDALLSLALVFDRAGDTEKATATLAEAVRRGASVSSNGDEYVAVPSDKLALTALSLEAKSSESAAAMWQKFIEADPASPFVKAAKERIALLRHSPLKKAGP